MITDIDETYAGSNEESFQKLLAVMHPWLMAHTHQAGYGMTPYEFPESHPNKKLPGGPKIDLATRQVTDEAQAKAAEAAGDAALATEIREKLDKEAAALLFDKQSGTWSAQGPATEVRRSDERQAVLSVLAEKGRPMSPTELSIKLDVPSANVRQLLQGMMTSGEISKRGRGLYVINDNGEEEATTED